MKDSSYPKISIITPNFNGSEYLEETILSVLGQNYPNLEYIIVDGGSSDYSLEIIKKYEDQLTYWISEPDNGMYYALQKGFEKSTGEIMAWINSDDMYHKNAFSTIADIFNSFQQVNWLSGPCTIYDELGRTIFCSQSRLFTKFDFYNHDFMFIQQESVFWRRSLWEKAGAYLNVKLKYAGDFDLWLRFFQHDRLFITSALIGGFRVRKSNQLSLDYFEEYLQEADLTIARIKINEEEKNKLLKYKILKRIESFCRRFKIIRTDWLIQYYSSRYLLKPSKIIFDRYSMKFILSD